MSGDWTNSVSVRTPDNSMDSSFTSRERHSPAMQHLMHLSSDKEEDDSELLPVPVPSPTFNNNNNKNKNKNNYPFFVSVKKNGNL